MKILFCHLLNNYTGSPKVLSQELALLSSKSDYKISLLTSKTDGILSNLQNVSIYDNKYRWSNNHFLLAGLFLFAQIYSFFFVFFHNYDVVYINTLVPFGAAIAAKVRHKKIIYHIHEVYIKTGLLKRFYTKIMEICADRVICVSEYVRENNPSVMDRSCVIYNPIEYHKMRVNLEEYLQKKFNNKLIFMPTSLKEYKGVYQFIGLARMLPDFKFRLLCSTSLEDMNIYFSNIALPENLELIGKHNNIFEFYKEATITVNMSLPDKWIETFGLTIVESFDTYTPVVAPAYGGPKEIITDGENGFLVNPYKFDQITLAINKIMKNFTVYKHFSLEAKRNIEKYDVNQFLEKISNIIREVVK